MLQSLPTSKWTYDQVRSDVELSLQQFTGDWSTVDRIRPRAIQSTGVV